MADVLIKCSKCGKHVESSRLLVEKQGNLICQNCYEKIHPEKKQQIVQKEKFECIDCSYKFTRAVGSKISTKCPYCNSLRTRHYSGRTADDILREVGDV